MSLLISKNWLGSGPLRLCVAASVVTYLALAQWPHDFAQNDGDAETRIAGHLADACYAHIAAASGSALVNQGHSCGPLFTTAYANALGLESAGAELPSSSESSDQTLRAVSPIDADVTPEDAVMAGRPVSDGESSGADLQAPGAEAAPGPDRSCQSLFTRAYLLQRGEDGTEGAHEAGDIASADSPTDAAQAPESPGDLQAELKAPSNAAVAKPQPGPSRSLQASLNPPKSATKSVKAAKRPSRPAHLKAWWPSRREGQLNILFVGGADFVTAIGLLSDGRFVDAASANRSIRVKDASGKSVNALWSVSSNPALLLLRVEPGLYSVAIDSALTDAQGRRLGVTASGEVFVD